MKKVWKNSKVLIGILVVLMIAGSFAACGGSGSTEGESAEQGTVAALQGGETETTAEATTATTSSTTAATSETNTDSGVVNNGDSNDSDGSGGTTAVCYVTLEGADSGNFTNQAVEYKSGDTAYSVLKKTSATVSAKKTELGIYVDVINGLAEFDKGDESGWKYSVNGKEPSVSCNKYKVKKGDKIKWFYVTSY